MGLHGVSFDDGGGAPVTEPYFGYTTTGNEQLMHDRAMAALRGQGISYYPTLPGTLYYPTTPQARPTT